MTAEQRQFFASCIAAVLFLVAAYTLTGMKPWIDPPARITISAR
jgi:hypothetical protein